MKRRTALGILGAFPIIGPATLALAQEPTYEVACISWCWKDAAPVLWGTAKCIDENDALKFINECYDKWAEKESDLRGMPHKKWENEENKRFKPFTFLDDRQRWQPSPLRDGTEWNGFQAAVKKL
jgi:hypothetical protein